MRGVCGSGAADRVLLDHLLAAGHLSVRPGSHTGSHGMYSFWALSSANTPRHHGAAIVMREFVRCSGAMVPWFAHTIQSFIQCIFQVDSGICCSILATLVNSRHNVTTRCAGPLPMLVAAARSLEGLHLLRELLVVRLGMYHMAAGNRSWGNASRASIWRTELARGDQSW